ncbi:MAG: hypothetical protein WCK48_02770 [bacterium]
MLDLINFFDSIFKKNGFSEKEIKKLVGNFSAIYMCNLIADAELSELQQLEVNRLSEASEWNEILNLIRLKFPNDQVWAEYCEKIFVSLMDEYFKEVVH